VLETLPFALAIAASPFPIIPAILLLFTERPRPTSFAFLAGWLLGIGAATTVFVLVSEAVESSESSPAWVSWVRVGLGSLLVAYGLRQWFTRAAKTEPPAWMRSLETATPSSAFRLALVLSGVNPKVVLIAGGAGLAIGSGDLHGWAEVVAVLVFTAVAAVSVAVPVVGYAVLGDRVLRPLGAAKDWLTTNNAAVMSVVLVVLGIALVVKGIPGL
jgi:threonine/homoserine/homoserine lactone efflux protein